MRKNIARALVMMTVMAAAVAFSACGSKKTAETTVAAAETTAAMAESSAAAESGAEAVESGAEESQEAAKTESGAEMKEESRKAAEEQTVNGTISEIKDFMFTLETEDGKAYALAFEQGKEPEGLADVKDGDKVTVAYTGELSEVDVFEGTIISVKAAK